ncbi:MAG: zinc-binding dehydrogenase [Natronomonas sp.]|uniref:zinc-binding dehydrogenase n=1 Tax=Natronomonas sp. TaxID=2184060 RepID=UPI0028703638|nr:zinc-binding dehydrogenase [Natronomonas sp.]MDR9381154.1 zinc-binding dehydrogenase [Natronomonas sp.]MDR9429922.1 zinc-binding dehydrogenase [Natronomonas sp.]
MTDERTGTLAYMVEPENVQIKEYPVPDPEPGAVLTEVERANVCGSELHIWRGHHPEVKDGALGHEALCRIEELGEGVETDYAGNPIEPGDLVAPAYFITCRKCPACQNGQFNLCENAYKHWSKSPEEPPHFHGTFGTHYYINPDQYFYKVPEGLDENIAAGANCALSQMIFGIDKVDLSEGETVVVQGAGGLGLNTIAVAKERGANVIVIEGVDGRLERAEAFGADHTIDFREYETVDARAERVKALTDGVGADVGVEVAGVPPAFSEGIHLVRKGGRYLEIGNVSPGHTTEFDPGLLTRRAIEIHPVVRYDPWYLRRALEFLGEHAEDYPYDQLIDTEFDLLDVSEALERSDSREVTRATLLPH